MNRLMRDGTAKPVSRDQFLRRKRAQGNIHLPCSADHEQDWQPYPVDPYSCYMCLPYIHTYNYGIGMSKLLHYIIYLFEHLRCKVEVSLPVQPAVGNHLVDEGRLRLHPRWSPSPPPHSNLRLLYASLLRVRSYQPTPLGVHRPVRRLQQESDQSGPKLYLCAKGPGRVVEAVQRVLRLRGQLEEGWRNVSG